MPMFIPHTTHTSHWYIHLNPLTEKLIDSWNFFSRLDLSLLFFPPPHKICHVHKFPSMHMPYTTGTESGLNYDMWRSARGWARVISKRKKKGKKKLVEEIFHISNEARAWTSRKKKEGDTKRKFNSCGYGRASWSKNMQIRGKKEWEKGKVESCWKNYFYNRLERAEGWLDDVKGLSTTTSGGGKSTRRKTFYFFFFSLSAVFPSSFFFCRW